MTPEDALQVTELYRRYGRIEALAGLSFTVPAGSFFGLFGRNGAGKTTCLDIATGLTVRDRGRVRLLGEEVGLEPSPETKARFGYVGGHIQLYGTLTLRRHLDFVAGFYPNWDADYCQELLELFRLPLEQVVLGLSPGMHLQFQLVMALAHHPELLIIDEPGNLDPVVRARLMSSIRRVLQQRERMVLMASHLLDELDGVCTHMCIIDRGRALLSGPVAELTAQAREVRLQGVPLSGPPPLPGVHYFESGGPVWRVVTTSGGDERAAALQAQLQAESAEVLPVGLQDFFIALTADTEEAL